MVNDSIFQSCVAVMALSTFQTLAWTTTSDSSTTTKRRRALASNEFWTMPQMVRAKTELEAQRALLESFLLDDSWSMSMSMPLSSMAPTPAPSTSPTAATDDGVSTDDPNNDDASGVSTPAPSTITTDDGIVSLTEPPTASPVVSTLAPNDSGSTTDPNESTIPDEGVTGSDKGGKSGGMAWIAGAVLGVAAVALAAVWVARRRKGGNAAGMFKLGGVGTGESAGSSISSNSPLQEV